MKLLLNLLAASSMVWLPAGTAHAQRSAPMAFGVDDSSVYRAVPMKARKPMRWRSDSADTALDSGTHPKGSTDFDPAAVEADRAKKAAKLAVAERERNSHIRPGAPNCVLKPVMSDAEIAACRSN